MKKRRLLYAILTVIMTLTMTAPAFALGPVTEPVVIPSGEKRTYDPTQADIGIIEESYTRGAKVPDKYFNLNGAVYSIDGIFDTTIYTSYYFQPNAAGELFYDITFRWQIENSEGVPNMRGAQVQCWDKTEGKMVTNGPFEMELQPNGLYGLTIKTGIWKVYNLDPTHYYYFRFTKSYDGFNASVTGVIYA